MHKIAVTTSSFGKYGGTVLGRLEEKGFHIVLNQSGRKLVKGEIDDLCRDAAGIIAGTENYDQDTLERLKRLKVISRCGTGLDNIDIKAADKLGIKVFNTPGAPTLAVAELTVGLILNLLRNVSLMDREIRESKWQKIMGNLLNGKKIGITGFGSIGQKTAELLSGFQVELAYCDLQKKKCTLTCSEMSLQDMLGWADIITLHVSAKKDFVPVIGRKEIEKMRKGSWLINISRGGIVDESALYDALSSGHLAGAALDVFEEEPYHNHLINLKNVILTPHIGSYAKEVRIEMEKQAVENLLKGLEE